MLWVINLILMSFNRLIVAFSSRKEDLRYLLLRCFRAKPRIMLLMASSCSYLILKLVANKPVFYMYILDFEVNSYLVSSFLNVYDIPILP